MVYQLSEGLSTFLKLHQSAKFLGATTILLGCKE